jgi:hypothetical protein
VDVPIWPSGVARYADGTLEVTTGDGRRVAASDITRIEIEPPKLGRLSLALEYRAGLGTTKTGYWVEQEHEAGLRELVDAVARDAAGH